MSSADRHIVEIARFFLWLGVTGFGGPAVHLALLEEQVVRKRRWVTGAEFLDLLGLTNLIPGPNSTEMAMALGYRRGGWPGLVVAGTCFILPAALLTAALAAIYVRYGSLPVLARLLAGLGPAVIVVMVLGAWRLGRSALSSAADTVLAAAVVVLALAGVDEVLLLLGAALVGALGGRFFVLMALVPVAVGAATGPEAIVRPSLAALAGFFLQIGAVLYGGGYVLVALLQAAVEPRGWLTPQELVDAVAAGQVTPGPVLTTATFAGFVMAGPAGAAVATIAIFLPAFVFTSLLGPYTDRIRASATLHRAVRSVSVAAVAVMGAVIVELASLVLRGPWTVIPLGAATLAALSRRSTPVVLGAGMAGALLVSVLSGVFG